jgi:4-amino-4-deoxy-L-arabinose transferase-like glycosyltransferase
MEKNNPASGVNSRVWIFMLLALFASIAGLFTVANLKITPDSIRYALISQQVLSGNGIRLPMIRLVYDLNVAADGTIPYLEQPPLLPLVLAGLGGVSSQNIFAAQVLNVICHVVISILTYLIFKKLYDNSWIALLSGILVSFSYPILRLTNRIGSDTLFMVFICASIFFLIGSRDSEINRSRRNNLLSGICSSAAILTRYAGITLIPLYVWEALLLLKSGRIRSRWVSSLMAVTLPVLTTAALFTRNYIISGTIRGFDQPSPERSYLDAFTGTVRMIFEQFHLGERSITVIFIFTLLCIVYFLFSAGTRRELVPHIKSGLDIIVVFIIIYAAFIFITLATAQPRFELRYVAPLVPFLFITGMFAIVFVWTMIDRKRYTALSKVGIISSLVILTLGCSYKTVISLSEIYESQEKYNFFLNSCTYKWIQENYAKDEIIATNVPFPLSYYGGYATLRLPHNRFNRNFAVPEDMETSLPKRMSEIGSRVLALFNNVEEKHEGKYIARLFHQRESDINYTLEHECPDGVVYNIRK